MNIFKLFLCLSFFLSVGASSFESERSVTKGVENKSCPQFQAYGFPKPNNEGVRNRSYYLCKWGYSGMYDPKEKSPVWVAEHLVKGSIEGSAKRKDLRFEADPEIPASDSTGVKSFRKYGDFDQGHLAPAGDFSYDLKAMAETFYYTNAVPQVSSHNEKIWASLEGAVREIAERRGELFVYTGVVYSDKRHKTIGDGVAVPDALFKVLVDKKAFQSTAFLIPNKGEDEIGTDFTKYQISVRELEKSSGLNFDPDLSKQEADKLEVSGGDWIMPKIRIRFKN